jgi:hypothetical protein
MPRLKKSAARAKKRRRFEPFHRFKSKKDVALQTARNVATEIEEELATDDDDSDSGNDSESELVDRDTNFVEVYGGECDCSEELENVLGLDVTVDLENLCRACDLAIDEVEKRWRSIGSNSNVRGAGTSRSTYFRDKAKKIVTNDVARNLSQPISNFFVHKAAPTPVGDETDSDDDFDKTDDFDNKRILTERGLWRNGMTLECKPCKDDIPLGDRRAYYVNDEGNSIYTDDHPLFTDQCCARGCLRRQPDFVAQKEWLREVVENAGCIMIFYPKFHCEFNFIEMTWGFMKSYLRRHCTFNFTDLKAKINGLLAPGGIPIDKIQNFARFCYRFMDGYRQGLSGPILDYTMKKCSKHRSIPRDIIERVLGDDGEFAKYQAKKQQRRAQK